MNRLSILFVVLFFINTYAQEPQCPGFAPSRLIVGEQGRVTPGDPNNVRENPDSDATRIGQIPGGGIFTIIDGPVCADGFAWWKVEYSGLVGWTVEGSGTTYWLEPLTQDESSEFAENIITVNNLTNLRVRELDFTDLTDFAFSPDSRWGAFYENDGIWTIDYSIPDVGASLLVRSDVLSGVSYDRRSIEFTASNLLAYYLDGELVFAKPDTGEVEFTLPVGFIADFIIHGDLIVSHSYDTVEIWDVNLRTRLFELQNDEDSRYQAIAINSDSTRLAAATDTGNVYVWNAENGSLVHRLSLNAYGNPDESVYNLAFSPDRMYLAGASGQQVMLWDLVTGTRVATLAGRNQVLYSPDGSLLFTVHPYDVPSDELEQRNDVVVYDSQNGNLLATLRLYQSSTYATRNLTFRPDGTALFMVRVEASTVGENTPLEWTITDATSSDVALVNQNENTCGGFLPSRLSVGDVARVLPNIDFVNLRIQPSSSSNSLLQIAGNESFLVMDGPQCELGAAWWEVQLEDTIGWVAEGIADAYFLEPVPAQPETPQFAGDIIQLIGTSEIIDLCPSRDRQLLAVIDGVGMWIYDLNDLNSSPSLLYMPEQNVTDCEWNHSNSLLAISTATYPSTETGINAVWIWDVTTQTLMTQKEQSVPVQSIAFSPNDELLAVANADKLFLWHVIDSYEYGILQEGRRTGTDLIFNSDGRHLLENSFDYSGHIWDTTTGQVSEQMSITVPSGFMDAAGDPVFANPVLSSDGLTVASHTGNTIILWNGITGVQQQELPIISEDNTQDFASISGMAFSPDNNWLATSGDKLRLWDMTLSSPTILRHELTTSEVTHNVQFSLDGQYVLASNQRHTEIWNMNPLEKVVAVAGGNGMFSNDNRIITFSAEDISIWSLDGTLIAQLHSRI